jgi:methyl-accepting chemotaxis protein
VIFGILMTQLPFNSPIQKKLSIGQKKRFRINSIGSQLFLAVLGGAMVGLGTVGLFSYQFLEKLDQLTITDNLEKEVQDLDAQLQIGQTFLMSVASSVSFLNTNQNFLANDYKRFVISQMSARPSLVTGFGVMQTPNGLAKERQWFAPYISEYVAESIEDVKKGRAERLPMPYQKFIYSDLLISDNYFKQDYYINTTQAITPIWTEPYITPEYSFPLTTYGGAIKNRQGRVIAAFNGDVSLKDLVSAVKDKTVLRKTGYFALFSAQGNILAYPSNSEKVELLSNANKNPKLKAIWNQVQQKISHQPSGIIKLDSAFEYWAYRQVPSSKWVFLAAVPYSTVMNIALLNTLGGISIVAIILAGVVFVFSKYLSHRLYPILKECNLIAGENDSLLEKLEQQDEVGKVSVAFFNLVNQINEKEQKIREETARIVQQEVELDLAIHQQEESDILQRDVEHLLKAVGAVRRGNLTIQAPVSNRVTGLLSNTLNCLIEELARIITAVLATVDQVTQGVENLDNLAMTTAQKARQQTQAVDRVQGLMKSVSALSQENAQRAVSTNIAVQEAQTVVASGQNTLRTLSNQIDTLQKGTDQINRRVETLTDFVSLTTQFSKDQKRIAAMTRVLSLNASLISSRASEQQDPEQFAGVAREFATIADQVNDLATQTNQSLIFLQQRTGQIQTVVSGLDQDVTDINQLVQAFTSGVGQSRQSFTHIQSVTTQVAQAEQQVTQASLDIADAAQTTLQAIQDIANLAIDTEQQIQSTRSQSSSMEELAHNLSEMVKFFSVPTRRSVLSPEAERQDFILQGKL